MSSSAAGKIPSYQMAVRTDDYRLYHQHQPVTQPGGRKDGWVTQWVKYHAASRPNEEALGVYFWQRFSISLPAKCLLHK
ncbi:hypothetical protein P167DRAFT_303414 [Morchella conica CCBAS932]|uniref:Uncharacterized protein n=1 Tax=Morchella conica CCBAS932 TaxID=1392247 RepID=A0A3N4KM15_9PEZI|nr:hypothetical protein P167DRAFT_303414 [Morchella conica CCBAS932]